MMNSISNGSRSIASNAGASKASCTVEWCSAATALISSRPSARAARIRACRTPRISPGSSLSCSRKKRREALIASYDLERGQAADDNIRHSTRSTDFIAPHSAEEARLRDATLALARHADFAKRMVNSGRLSSASAYDTPLSTPDTDRLERRRAAWRRDAGCDAAARRRKPLSHRDRRAALHLALRRRRRAAANSIVHRACRDQRHGARPVGAARRAKPIRDAATMRRQARPICCGRTGMWRPVSGRRPQARSRPRWSRACGKG